MKIAISAGDPSGDEHGAKIVRALRAKNPDIELFGMGGSHLRAVGVRTIVDSETEASVMGASDVIHALPRLRRAFNRLVESLRVEHPDTLLLVDYQEFNLMLAKAAKKLGIRTVFFIAPTVWAWRPGRAKQFAKYVDHLACIFPFEPKVFQELGYDRATFVGHPFTDTPGLFEYSDEQKEKIRSELGIPPDHKVVALFPGSRKQEVKLLLNELLSGFALAQKQHGKLAAVIPVPSSIAVEEIQRQAAHIPNIYLLPNRSLDALAISDCGLIKSGTSNLQAAMMCVPFTMVYRAGWLMSFVVKRFVGVNNYSIVNIIREGSVKELVTPDAVTPKNLAEEILQLLTDTKKIGEIRTALKEVKEKLSGVGSGVPVAERVCELVVGKG